jgi:hypothetical protein
VSDEIEARAEETPHVFISDDMIAPEIEPVAETEPKIIELTTEKEAEKSALTRTGQQIKPSTPSPEPHNDDVRIVDVYLIRFGWIKDEGSSIGTMSAIRRRARRPTSWITRSAAQRDV